MTRSLALISLLGLAMTAVACTSSHSMPDDGGTGGDAEPPPDDAGRDAEPPPDDAGRDAEPPPPPPPECAVETDREGPFETTFRFVNETDEQLYVQRTCRLQFSLQSCASGYEPVSMWAGCTIDCSESGACVACGACMFAAEEVTSGMPVEITWPGNTFTFGETPSGCRCHETHVAQPGKYRVSVPVYASEEDAMSGDVLREVTYDFELPAPDGVVTVPLGE